ncbi:Hypothetical protein, putative [Bodo saltans]|uniref:RNA-editing substrate-binding complex 7 protein domain-containing protein n=1 Tax=Bodo saltans TaxID=75058 RepID=A0A0S4JEB4_BODSA|nr:Hypothetical protein, putative [Bodo saltans]|eukprot:CUG87759.1 Hypothetical protein, putative [Bodo saltans]
MMRSAAFARRTVISGACAGSLMNALSAASPASVPQSFLVVAPLCMARRSFATTELLMCSAQTKPTESASSGPSTVESGAAADAAASALDIAMRVNKLKRLHQTGGNANSGKKQLEFTAWKELNALSEEQINHAEGKAVALLLNSWAYFAKFWEKGKDGPHGVNAPEGEASAQN